MRPAEVLDAQLDLMDRLEHVPGFAAILGGTMLHGTDDDLTTMQNRTEYLRGSLLAITREALAYRVTADMSLMVEHLAAQLDDSDMFFSELAPSPEGIVRFERPLPVIDARGEVMLAHWLTWGPTGVRTLTGPGGMPRDPSVDRLTMPSAAPRTVLNGIDVVNAPADTAQNATMAGWWNDAHDGPDSYTSRMLEMHGSKLTNMTGRWFLMGLDLIGDGEIVGTPTSPLHADVTSRVLEEGGVPQEVTNVTRYLYALWLLLGQKLTKLSPEFPDRAGRRRWEKKMPWPGSVTVIRLRHVEHMRDPEESVVEWTHRWLSRAHPRWQPMGQRDCPEGEHEWSKVTEVYGGRVTRWCLNDDCTAHVDRIIVAESVKGPVGAPLIVTQKLYNLER